MDNTVIERAIKNLGFEKLNEMQEISLQANRDNNDVVLVSPTGSGKTVGFLLPLLEKLKKEQEGVQAVIICPSRELALQIEQVFKKMGTGYKINACYGGHAMKTERNNLSTPPADLVGTPGRLADHITRGTVDLQFVHTLVLDEFDKALELGFKKDMAFIIEELVSLDKRMLTSATQALKIPPFTGVIEHKKLNFSKDVISPKLTLKKVIATGKDKLHSLFQLVCKFGNEPTLIFCNHRDAVERISEILWDQGLFHESFHGGLEQEDRERALLKFRNGSHHILICTDLASRGLDIPEIKHVIHYQLPLQEEAFIHRNGRTARMNAEGTAYLVFGENEKYPEYIKDKIGKEEVPENIILPKEPIWSTLYIGGGKKDKINKIDIVGLLMKKGGLEKDEVGLIEVHDFSSYVAVSKVKIESVLKKLKGEKIKKKKVKLAISK
jgi:superfamily II DNA/RNA helicase